MFDQIELVREFFEGLTAIDETIVARVAAAACPVCGGPLHRGDYVPVRRAMGPPLRRVMGPGRRCEQPVVRVPPIGPGVHGRENGSRAG